MIVHVNGEEREVADDLTLAGLLDELELATERVAVEVNRSLVVRAAHAGTRLAPGDRIEIVTLVGGG